MNKTFSTKRLCRAGVIAALYVALTYAFMPFAFGPVQVRPAEALCLLPLFFPEAVPALYVGCMLSNVASPYAFYDVFIGSLVTLFSAFGTYMVGLFFKKNGWKVFFGGIFPVLFNTFLIPIIIVYLCGTYTSASAALTTYFTTAFSLFITETVWVYGLGTPLYMGVNTLKQKRIKFFD